jgi:D-arabinose 1-dehydrogenase-like Zn-dependent alcohol dehydrogenase
MYGEADLDQASMGHYAVWKASFLYAIPESMDRANAAPLMCGGATVYSALASFGAAQNHRVGIIGLGGLGHLAIQFANKMGCQVVVFSQTDSKKEEAMKLGATEFVTTKGKESLECDPIDHLIITTSFQPDWKLFVPIMAPGGTIYPLTVSLDDFSIPYMPLLMGELTVQGSLVAARQVHRDMLEFAAFHKIQPMIEKFPMTVEGITAAFDKLREGKMRYRGVLVNESA